MIDYETMIKALRLSWLKRITDVTEVFGRVTSIIFWKMKGVFFYYFSVIMM